MIAKFWKVIFISLAALAAGIWKWISGRKKDELPAIEEGSADNNNGVV